MKQLKKIVAIGPESTGKSTLCAQLSAHYNTTWVKEYARNFLENNSKYTYEDLLIIAKGQLELEDKITLDYQPSATSGQLPALNFEPEISKDLAFARSASSGMQNNFLFIDTDMHVMQVWCEFVYNRCHNWILNQIATRQYDGYLLCNIDLPWEQDGMREYPDKKIREKLYEFYREMMINQNIPWVEISGNQKERMKMAISFVEGL